MKTLLTLILITLPLLGKGQMYIDPTFTGSSKGTVTAPYKTFPPLTKGSTYLLKSGTTLTGNFSLYGSNVTISSYGIGNRPVIKYSYKTSRLLFLSGSNNTINGIDFIQGADDSSNEGLLIYGTGNTVKNCKVTGGAPGIEFYNGDKGNGGKCTVYNVELVNSVSDALYINQLDYVNIKKVNVHDLAVTNETSSSIDAVHIIYPLRVDIDSCYIDHSTAPGKYGLICTAQNISGKSNGGMLVKNTTILSGSNQGCTFPALDTAQFVNCTFKGGMRFVQTPADILKMTNCTFTGTSQLIWGVEQSENQSFTNCLFSSIPSGIKAILNPSATLKQVTINGGNYNGAYNGGTTEPPIPPVTPIDNCTSAIDSVKLLKQQVLDSQSQLKIKSDSCLFYKNKINQVKGIVSF